ncbi:MAG: hypothetical protein WEB57_11970 [Pseudohongiellaceae bacterium]
MNRNKIKGHAEEAKRKEKEFTKKVADDKGTDSTGKPEKNDGKSGAVLADLNDTTRRK